MASAMQLMKHANVGFAMPGIKGVVAGGVAGFGASYAIGQAYHRYSDKWYGKHAARLAAVAGKVGALVSSAMIGPGIVTGTVDAVGQAGINAIGLEMGLRHARAATGKKAVLVPAGTDIKKISGASDITSMGALGRAAAGRGLSWDQIEELASAR